MPYIVALPLVFQTTEEWLISTLGLHPIQVALQVALPELDGGMEPIVFSGRDARTGMDYFHLKQIFKFFYLKDWFSLRSLVSEKLLQYKSESCVNIMTTYSGIIPTSLVLQLFDVYFYIFNF